MVIDKARQLGTILIIKAAHITERLGDDITLTEICREAGVVNRRISTVRYCLSRRAGLGGGKITNSSKMIGDKIVNIRLKVTKTSPVRFRNGEFFLCI